ncbi:MAG TPA: tripartite tricarboxylate transporter substrate binding protein [Xanthobacteraceae bacterium]|jgi:tripartite-type tricarboxylate transporter receptor subunit TctC
MKPSRRGFLQLAAIGGVSLPAVTRIARAQVYPTRPVRIIAGLPAGSTSDLVGRLIGQWLSEAVGQPFVIENRVGAGTNVGTEVVVKSPPDGYTLLLVVAANAINVTFYEKLNFNFIRDITPIARVSGTPFIMEVNPSLPVRTVPEFIAYTKVNPGKLNMASAGNGTLQHVAGELFKMMAGVDMRHVPYRGSPQALTDLLGGQVQVMFDTVPTSAEYIKAGKLRPLAVTTANRLEVLPDVPTVAEFVPGYEATGWVGIGAPKNTPAEIIAKLNREINAALADPKMKAKLADLGGAALAGSPADFGKLIAEETEKWAKVIKFAGIKPE